MSVAGFGLNNFDGSARTSGAGTGNAYVKHPYDEKNPNHHVAPEVNNEEEGNAAVGKLARQMTSHSTRDPEADGDENPFNAPAGSSLDPNSDKFNARAWIKSMMKLSARDPDNFKARSSGIAFKDLNVHGFGTDTDYQKTVGNVIFEIPGLFNKLMGRGQRKIDILQNFDGLVRDGEMLVVLGPPGSGCSTLLKTISGETNGLFVDEKSYINYRGISAKDMQKQFRGEAIYTAEVDVHFPQMTVGETLYFAAQARAPQVIPGGVSRKVYAEHLAAVLMAIFGIAHTKNTRVGNDFVRGVSGGERKRVTICEAALSGAPLQCWDNSTRGLDSANAIEFCKTLRTSTELANSAAIVAIYQAPQAAYDLFDKVTILYEGHQIYFGHTKEARDFFIDMGFYQPEQQTTADFLTSLTSPIERRVQKGYEGRVPKTPQEFSAAWKKSSTYAKLMQEIDEYAKTYEIGGKHKEEFVASRKAQQAKRQRVKSPYTLSYGQQIKLCLWRGFKRLLADPSLTFTQLFGNFAMGLIVSSVFYNLSQTTESFFQRSALLFFAVLLNAFGAALEILTLYAQRPIVEKHDRYALYHPSAEAFASMLTDMPYKIANAICFNLVIYFMSNLRREPGAFFFYLLISFTLTLFMSMLFRFIGSASRTLTQALAPTAVLILAIVIYTGFAINVDNMLGWARWINYINPIGYGFESLMINEFSGRQFACSSFVPSGGAYDAVTGTQRVCSTIGSVPGSDFVSGTDYIAQSYSYLPSHKWRNFGIIIGFLIFFLFLYLLAAEKVSAKKSKGEVLVFPRRQLKAIAKSASHDDLETGSDTTAVERRSTEQEKVSSVIQKQTAIFHWQGMTYDIKIKGEDRRILDHVDGWVVPGTMTALMGVSGAGKTTLLDVLATRVTMGVISGEALVDGRPRDDSFQRKTGYVQQQDLHLETATVRESLVFSAVTRQPANVPRQEKVDYVEEVIKLLDMEAYADAVVGVPGEGLNVEQRKRLTIGVELAAKPQLLLFLDEPTSGLDSQTSWAIADLMEKLTKAGQAILCTIHQPSAMLFERFDRLLFLAKGGRTVYFGEVGHGSETLIKYFESQGAPKCPPTANPAEWMLTAIGAAPGSHTDIDWHDAWKNSNEFKAVQDQLATYKRELSQKESVADAGDKSQFKEFAAPFGVQLYEVTKRSFQLIWRSPSYIGSKTLLCVASALFIGFSFFNASNTQTGLQNQMFAVFMIFTIFGQLLQQIMPFFVTQRALYEVRERPAKTYSWKAFMLANIFVELPWNTLMAVLIFACWYFPPGFYRNAEYTGAFNQRNGLVFLFMWQFLLFTSTFAHMVIAAIPTAETAGNIGNLMFSMSLIFCGILVQPQNLVGFWIWMYRISPFTYLAGGLLSTSLANAPLTCSDVELVTVQPPAGQTCIAYLQDYITSIGGGYVANENATADCQFCSASSTNSFLSSISVSYSTRWRDFGILNAYIVFNVAAALFLYWLVRVPKKAKAKKEKKE